MFIILAYKKSRACHSTSPPPHLYQVGLISLIGGLHCQKAVPEVLEALRAGSAALSSTDGDPVPLTGELEGQQVQVLADSGGRRLAHRAEQLQSRSGRGA